MLVKFKIAVSARQVYNLLNKYRESGYKLSSLIPERSNGGEGKGRIDEVLEKIIIATINGSYLNSQRNKISKVIEDIQLKCFNANLKPPSACTIRRRLSNFGIEKKIISRVVAIIIHFSALLHE